MYCANCGKEMNDGVKFCPNCGNAAVPSQAPAAATEESVDAPVEEVVAEAPVVDAPVVDAPVEDVVETVADEAVEAVDAPVEDVAAEAPVVDAPVVDAPVEEVVETVAEDAVDAPVEDAVEAVADEAVAAVDAPVEEVVAEAPVAPIPPVTPEPVMDPQAQYQQAPVQGIDAQYQQAPAPGMDAQYQQAPAPGMQPQYQQAPAPGMPGQYAPGVPVEPTKKTSKLPIIIIAVIVVLCLAAAAVFALPMLFGSKSNNPIAATYDGIKSVLNAESFDARLSYLEDDGTEAQDVINLSVIWGKDFASSVISYDQVMNDGEFRTRYILIDDTMVTAWYIDEDDPDSFYESKTDVSKYISDSLSDEFGIDIDIDDIVSNNELNPDVIFEELTNAINDLAGSTGLDIKVSSIEGVVNVLEDFIYERCSDKEVLAKIVPESTKSKSSGKTTQEYSINLLKFLEQFDIYLKEISDDSKYLKKHKLDVDDVNALKLVMGFTSALGAVELENPTVKVTLDKNDNLVELVVKPNTKGYDDKISETAVIIAVENYNKSKVDLDELRDRVKGATPID